MKVCRCGEPNGVDAKFCMKCGSRFQSASPAKHFSRWFLVGCIAVAVLLVVIVAVVMTNSDSSGRAPGSQRTAGYASAPPDVILNDGKALYDRYDAPATEACDDGADDYLRSIAKYDFKWDDLGWFEFKFDRHSPVAPQPGVLIMWTDKVKLQNVFGAFQHIELDCEYDTQTGEVLRYSFQQADVP